MNNEYKAYLDKLLKTFDNRISHLDKRQCEEKWSNQEIRNIMEPVRSERQLVYRILIRDPELLEADK